MSLRKDPLIPSSESAPDDQEADPNIIEQPVSFTFFGKLPSELRVKIWGYAHPGPRVVEVNERDRLASYSHLFPYADISGEFTSTMNNCTKRPPALLHVNQESRYEALKDYELVPANELLGLCGSDAKTKIYFNFDLDTVYISKATFFQFKTLFDGQHEDNAARRIKHLAIDSIAVSSGNHGGFLNYRGICLSLKTLETLTFVRNWTIWNSPVWDPWRMDGLSRYGYHDYGPRTIPSYNVTRCIMASYNVWGLSLAEHCSRERYIREQFYHEQAMMKKAAEEHPDISPGLLPLKHPTILLEAYFGTGKFVPAYGDILIPEVENVILPEQGPLQQPFLKGAEAKLVPQKIQHAMKEFRVKEDEDEKPWYRR